MNTVFVKTRFPAYHRWIDAPEEHKELRDFHRHEFHVELHVAVTHDNRDMEFIALKRKLDEWLTGTYREGRLELSCEQMAKSVVEAFNGVGCMVSEDGENGAVVWRSRPSLWEWKKVKAPSANGFFNLHMIENVYNVPKSRRKAETVEVSFDAAGQMYSTGKVTDPAVEGFWKGGYPVFTAPLPSQTVKTKCFVGKEVEGPHRGDMTLFVPGPVGPVEFEAAFRKWCVPINAVAVTATTTPSAAPLSAGGPICRRVYLGAGNLPFPRYDTFCRMMGLIDYKEFVTVEIESMDAIGGFVNQVQFAGKGFEVLSRHKGDAARSGVKYVKHTFDKEIIWKDAMGRIWTSKTDDPWYAEDKDA